MWGLELEKGGGLWGWAWGGGEKDRKGAGGREGRGSTLKKRFKEWTDTVKYVQKTVYVPKTYPHATL